MKGQHTIVIPENPVSRFLFSDTRSAFIWLIIRLYVGSCMAEGWMGESAK